MDTSSKSIIKVSAIPLKDPFIFKHMQICAVLHYF